jgi:predicted enzyme related to lactoylglutathione lyase
VDFGRRGRISAETGGNDVSTRDERWPQGTPNWVDLTTPDLAASNEFYRTLFGWEIVDTGEEGGHYGLCMVNGRAAAGIGPAREGSDSPPVWTTYLAVDDAEKTAEAITAHGGMIVMPPMTVVDQGRVAIAQDPTGAYVGLWQADQMVGFQVYNEPGGVGWNEQISRHPDRARDFYAAVFGYTYEPVKGADPYWTFATADGRMAGGLGGMRQDAPADMPAHWMTYFVVASADDAAATVDGAGGTVAHGPFDSPFGRMAAIVDPHGAMFMIGEDATAAAAQS